MTFSSLPFLLFLPTVLLGMHLIKRKKPQQIFLLAASYFFYAWWDIRFLLLMIATTAICYLAALLMQRDQNRQTVYLTAASVLLLTVLGFFKYFNFFLDSLYALTGIGTAGTLSIILPIGISFYTFQGISYLIDVKRGTVKAQRSFVAISLYISFFAQLVAGPIVRSSDFLPQLDSPAVIRKQNLWEGLQIFVFGFIKKRVIADRIGSFVTAVYLMPQEYGSLTLWLAVLAYAVQIYFDFSGYSDMAIGVAKMMGFTLQRNFNAPYLSKNPSEFWRRWHISLSQWLRDYLYFPLGGSRKGLIRTCINLLITMALSGLWHGANWNFILWGVLLGIAQALHAICKSIFKDSPQRKCDLFCILCTDIFIALAFVIFRCEDLSVAFAVFGGLIRPQQGILWISFYAVLGILLTVIGHIFTHKNGGVAYYPIMTRRSFGSILLLTVICLLAVCLAYTGENPFIYFQF